MIGHIDVFREGAIHGWHAVSAKRALIVEIDGRFAGIIRTHLERPDVVAAGYATDPCGFSFNVPPEFVDGGEHRVVVRATGEAMIEQLECLMELTPDAP